MLRSSAPPPDITMPLSMMSLDSSGGVFSSTWRTAVMTAWRGSSMASMTSELVSGMVLGRALPDHEVVLLAHVADDRFVEAVAPDAEGLAHDDTAEGDDRDLGRPP